MSKELAALEAAAKAYENSFESLNFPQILKRLSANGYPRFLYKYRPFESDKDKKHVRDIVVRSELWLSSPRRFNDPFDMGAKFVTHGTAAEQRRAYRDMLKEQHIPLKKIELLLPQLMRRANPAAVAQENARTIINTRTGVCSFGGDPRSILMWTHYSSNHQGVCLGFEIAKDPKTFWQACRVDYSTSYPIINWVSRIKGQAKTILLRKYKDWRYEDERRIVIFDQADQPLKFQPSALRLIIMGSNATENTYKQITDFLAERAQDGLPRVRLYECKRHESDYKLQVFRSRKNEPIT